MISSGDLAEVISQAIQENYPAVSVGIVKLDPGATMPSVVLHPFNITENDGSWDQPHEMGLISIGITCIGKSVRQASGIQAAIRSLLLSRTGSGYTTPLMVDGTETLWREPQTLGPVLPGDNVFKTDDFYSFKEMLI